MKHKDHQDEHFLPEGDEDLGKNFNGVSREVWDNDGDEFFDDTPGLLDHLLECFEEDQMKRFLEKLGYKIVTRKDHITDEEYLVAVSPDSPVIPEDEDMIDTFIREAKESILQFLLDHNGRKEKSKRRGSKSRDSK